MRLGLSLSLPMPAWRLGPAGSTPAPSEGTIDLIWNGDPEPLIPYLSLDFPDVAVGDVIKLRRYIAGNYSSYDEAEDTITSAPPDPVSIPTFDFGGDWALNDYEVYALQYRAAALIDTSNIETVTITGDITAPVLSLPVDIAVNATSGTGGFTTDEPCTGFVVVTPFAMAAPSGPQIIAGLGGDGNPAAYADSEAVAVAGAFTFTDDFTGLASGTQFKAHFVGRDDDLNVSNVVSGDGFTTASNFTPVYHFLWF